MLLTAIKLFISLALPLWAGYAVINLLFRRNELNLAVSLAISYGLGMGILTQWMFILGAFRIKFTLGNIGIPLLIFSLFFIFLGVKKKARDHLGPGSGEVSPTQKPLAASIFMKIFRSFLYIWLSIFIIYVFWRALNIPVYVWDAVATVAFKAKVLFFQRSLANLKNLPHAFYPLHVSFAQTWIAINLGAWDDQFIKIIFPFAFLSFLIIFDYFLNYYTNRIWSLLGMLMLISSNLFVLHATISYRDFFLLFYNCATVMFLIFWHNKQNDAYLILASLYAGFATFTKLEGTVFLFIYTTLFLIILSCLKVNSLKIKIGKFVKFTIPSFGICFLYYLYKFLAKVPAEKTQFDFSWSSLERIPLIFKKFTDELLFSENWNVVWFLLLLSLVLNSSKIKRSPGVRFLVIALGMFFGAYFLNSLLTANFIWISGNQSFTALSRLILHFYPLAVLIIILLNYPTKLRAA